MPGLEELLALQGGGGAPPQGGGGGQMAGLQQLLGQLMQDPAAMKGMQAHAQQNGIDMGALMPGGNAQGGPPQMPMDIPVDMAMEGGGPPPPDQAEAMAADQIDTAGQTWDGTDAPTQNDIERLQADPSQTNIDSFNDHFGEGMAEKYVESEGEEAEASESEAEY
jgi:hypothetical protein